MEVFASSRNITKLLDNIINILEENRMQSEELALYMAGLKRICFGSISERNSFSFLTHDEKLASILEITNFDKLFVMKRNECLDMADYLVNISIWTPEICKALNTLISSVLKKTKSNEAEPKTILTKVFYHKDFPQLPVELIEKIVDYDSTDLELYLINIYAKQRPNMLPWNDVNRKHWLKWCSQSSNLFYEFICILNELLIRTRKQRMIDITRNFAENLLKLCNENDIDYVALYPLRLQHLVSFMIINFEPLENSSISKLLKETFKSEFIRLRDENPAAALVIATHFAKCGTYIE